MIDTCRDTVLVIAIALGAGACGPATPSAVARPSTPPGWATVASEAGDLWVDLPPWIQPFETSDAVYANEMPGQDGSWVQVFALGPGAAVPEPSSAAEARAWLEAQIASPIAGPGAVRAVELPGGVAIRIDRVDAAGTPRAWRLAAFAFRTPAGVALLVIDGPADAWTAREADLELIPQLIRFGPGSAGVPPFAHEDATQVVDAPRAGAPPPAP